MKTLTLLGSLPAVQQVETGELAVPWCLLGCPGGSSEVAVAFGTPSHLDGGMASTFFPLLLPCLWRQLHPPTHPTAMLGVPWRPWLSALERRRPCSLSMPATRTSCGSGLFARGFHGGAWKAGHCVSLVLAAAGGLTLTCHCSWGGVAGEEILHFSR